MTPKTTLIGAGLVMAVAAWSAVDAAGPQLSSRPSPPAVGHVNLVKQYCVTCHNERLQTAGLMLDRVVAADVADHRDVWEKVTRKLRLGVMPPPGLPRPDKQTTDSLIAWLEGELDRVAARDPNPGQPLVHRLNRTEYQNAVRDLLSLELDVSSMLPADDAAFGFDNISEVLGLSPVRVERYLSVAEWISALAIGEPGTSPSAQTYLVRQDRSQDRHIEGLPLGTVGGVAVRHLFPMDGEYTFELTLLRTNTDSLIGLELPHQVEIAVDGNRAFLETIGGEADRERSGGKGTPDARDGSKAAASPEDRLKLRMRVQAGPRTVTAAFLQQRGVGTRRLQPFVRSTASPYDSQGVPHIRTLAITGPFNVAGGGDTPSRRRIFICRPASPAEETSCARRILSNLARRAYRRPVAGQDLEPLMAFYESGRRDGTFEMGIQRALQRILASPKFLLRVEPQPVEGVSGAVYRIGDFELASRLSFFLWSSIPDDELLDVAGKGRLSTPAVLEQQVRRMLADPRAEALTRNFAGQWLQLRNLQNAVPDPNEFPDFDDQLRDSFARETELLFESIVKEDRNVLDLLTADYTFLNERLARHYGVEHVYGSHFRRVPVSNPVRRGLLGHGSILTITSHTDRTAPVLRGKWVLDNLLGTPPPPPPPDVTTDLPPTREGEAPRTVRERMIAHRNNPVCASCHKLMDPIGLALENFDAVGAWRTREAGRAIDATTELADGTAIDGAVALRESILEHPEVVVSTFTEKLLTYALGRGLQPYDMPVVRRVVREAAGQDYRFSSLLLGIVRSTPFQMRALDSHDALRSDGRSASASRALGGR